MNQPIYYTRRNPVTLREIKSGTDGFLFVKRDETTNIFSTFWKKFCDQTSMHGLKYITDKDTKGFEKKFWTFIVGSALVALLCSVCFLNFSNTGCELQTIIQNTSYSVSDLPFPSLTICPANRLDWSKFDRAQSKYLSRSASLQTKNLFRKFMLKFQQFHYDKFEIFTEFENTSMTALDDIDLKSILNYMTLSCKEFFVECFWVNQPINCCDAFVKRSTEAGFCYTFNAVITDEHRERAKNDSKFPWRASAPGVNNGLFIKVRIDSSKRSDDMLPDSDGVLVRIHDAGELPRVNMFIPQGTQQLISLEPILLQTVTEAKSIHSYVRQCLFQDEFTDPLYLTLPGYKFTFYNCQRQCRNINVQKYCNCTLDIFYPIMQNSRPCRASDFHCLAKHDNILGRSKKFKNDIGDGLVCYCLQSCAVLKLFFTPRTIENVKSLKNLISIDAYYLSDTIFKYQTYLARNWFDYVVYYGGVASFFLGCSLMSFIEILYYFTIRLGVFMYEKNTNKKKRANRDLEQKGQSETDTKMIGYFRPQIWQN